MWLQAFKKNIPKPIRNRLILLKWAIVRLPYALLYRLHLFKRSPVEKLINNLPTPAELPVYWTELKNITLHSSMPYHPPGRLCLDGDWDIHTTHPLPAILEEITRETKKWDIHETVRAIFLFGEHYTTTPQYKSMIMAVYQKAPNPPQGCRSVQEVDAYFERLIEAYKSIQTYGYLTQQELGNSGIGEMRIHITRDGKLCLGGGGNHRIRMAELAGVKWVPFLLKGVHPKWVQYVSQCMNLPPHRAIDKWIKDSFPVQRPSAIPEQKPIVS